MISGTDIVSSLTTKPSTIKVLSVLASQMSGATICEKSNIVDSLQDYVLIYRL